MLWGHGLRAIHSTIVTYSGMNVAGIDPSVNKQYRYEKTQVESVKLEGSRITVGMRKYVSAYSLRITEKEG